VVRRLLLLEFAAPLLAGPLPGVAAAVAVQVAPFRSLLDGYP
jgi:hypothetical protein